MVNAEKGGMLSHVVTWQDIAAAYKCGRSKALLLLHAAGPHYLGRTPYVEAGRWREFVREKNGNVQVPWPKRK